MKYDKDDWGPGKWPPQLWEMTLLADGVEVEEEIDNVDMTGATFWLFKRGKNGEHLGVEERGVRESLEVVYSQGDKKNAIKATIRVDLESNGE